MGADERCDRNVADGTEGGVDLFIDPHVKFPLSEMPLGSIEDHEVGLAIGLWRLISRNDYHLGRKSGSWFLERDYIMQVGSTAD